MGALKQKKFRLVIPYTVGTCFGVVRERELLSLLKDNPELPEKLKDALLEALGYGTELGTMRVEVGK